MKLHHVHRTRPTMLNDETSETHQEHLQLDKDVLHVQVEGDYFLAS